MYVVCSVKFFNGDKGPISEGAFHNPQKYSYKVDHFGNAYFTLTDPKEKLSDVELAKKRMLDFLQANSQVIHKMESKEEKVSFFMSLFGPRTKFLTYALTTNELGLMADYGVKIEVEHYNVEL
jgi:hypothetical protein